jgi:hypothetical protein
MSISELFRYRNDSFQSDIFSSDIRITDVDVGCRILPRLRAMSMHTYDSLIINVSRSHLDVPIFVFRLQRLC